MDGNTQILEDKVTILSEAVKQEACSLKDDVMECTMQEEQGQIKGENKPWKDSTREEEKVLEVENRTEASDEIQNKMTIEQPEVVGNDSEKANVALGKNEEIMNEDESQKKSEEPVPDCPPTSLHFVKIARIPKDVFNFMTRDETDQNTVRLNLSQMRHFLNELWANAKYVNASVWDECSFPTFDMAVPANAKKYTIVNNFKSDQITSTEETIAVNLEKYREQEIKNYAKMTDHQKRKTWSDLNRQYIIENNVISLANKGNAPPKQGDKRSKHESIPCQIKPAEPVTVADATGKPRKVAAATKPESGNVLKNETSRKRNAFNSTEGATPAKTRKEKFGSNENKKLLCNKRNNGIPDKTFRKQGPNQPTPQRLIYNNSSRFSKNDKTPWGSHNLPPQQYSNTGYQTAAHNRPMNVQRPLTEHFPSSSVSHFNNFKMDEHDRHAMERERQNLAESYSSHQRDYGGYQGYGVDHKERRTYVPGTEPYRTFDAYGQRTSNHSSIPPYPSSTGGYGYSNPNSGGYGSYSSTGYGAPY